VSNLQIIYLRPGAAFGRLSDFCGMAEPISCRSATVEACARVSLLVFVEFVESNVALVLQAV